LKHERYAVGFGGVLRSKGQHRGQRTLHHRSMPGQGTWGAPVG
jgi:hypothetical protein